MNGQNQGLDTLKDIKQMMERSSRFISLSGLSGISAGICALVGAWFASGVLKEHDTVNFHELIPGHRISVREFIDNELFSIALFTFIAALIAAFTFTYIRSKKENIPIWGTTSKRLLWNVAMPMIVGGIFLIRMIQLGYFGLIAPGCLIFYGLALVNASKYTLGEVKWLGYGQILLGIINCWYPGEGIYFWAVGFGVLHIIYGTMMWWKYERAS
ncbi:MAG: hypothetical protein C5B52_11275 [Bacteroidetes bacterium]|nr:MAG: hypothetical protein C5B52_11275 [Bacteroidota bacterium]